MSVAFLALFALGQSVAKADCIVTVATTNPVTGAFLNGNVPVTNLAVGFTGNTLNTSVSQAGPTVVTLGTLNPTSVIGIPNTLSVGNTFNLVGNLVVAGQTFSNGGILNLVGTIGLNADNQLVVNFDPVFVNSNLGAGVCATFSVQVNQINLALLANDPLPVTANLNVVACGTCGPDGLTPVPEPATMILLGTGVAGVAAKLRKRRKATQSETS